MIHDWFGNCKVAWVGVFFANSGSFGVHPIHLLRIRDLLGYTVYTILVWLVGGGNANIMDEFIDRVRRWGSTYRIIHIKRIYIELYIRYALHMRACSIGLLRNTCQGKAFTFLILQFWRRTMSRALRTTTRTSILPHMEGAMLLRLS